MELVCKLLFFYYKKHKLFDYNHIIWICLKFTLHSHSIQNIYFHKQMLSQIYSAWYFSSTKYHQNLKFCIVTQHQMISITKKIKTRNISLFYPTCKVTRKYIQNIKNNSLHLKTKLVSWFSRFQDQPMQKWLHIEEMFSANNLHWHSTLHWPTQWLYNNFYIDVK